MSNVNEKPQEPYKRARSKTLSNINEISPGDSSSNKGIDTDSHHSEELSSKAKSKVNGGFNFPNNNSKDELSTEASNSLSKLTAYFQSELGMAWEDLNLLETFNQRAIKEFNGMSRVTKTFISDGAKMNQAFSDFEPFLRQIDDINRQVDYLELVAAELDEYSLALEDKVKSLKKRRDVNKKGSIPVPTSGKRTS